MKLGSLFDGIGGFPLAATMNGIRPVWASEIEPFPMAVTAYRFPEMKHMGDITKLHGVFSTIIDISAVNKEYIVISGGKIGTQIKMNPLDLNKVIKVEFKDIKE